MHIIREKAVKTGMLIAILLLSAAILSTILFGIQQFKIGSQLTGVNRISGLSHLLVRQQANLFSMLLTENVSPEKLTEVLDSFSKEPFVLDASLYRYNGELITKSSNAFTVREQLGLDQKNKKENDLPTTQQVIEPILSKNGIEGFLRVTFNVEYEHTTRLKINHLFHRLYGEFIVVFLAGILLASSVHYFLSHYRRIYQKRHTSTPTLKLPLSPSQLRQFHRRRKRFSK